MNNQTVLGLEVLHGLNFINKPKMQSHDLFYQTFLSVNDLHRLKSGCSAYIYIDEIKSRGLYTWDMASSMTHIQMRGN